MSYTPTTWVDGVTKVGPTNLNKLEDGARDAYTQAHGFINVMDVAYGAKGDGVTDDTAAINSAITALLSAGSGKIHFPPGDYLISGPLTVKPSNHQTVPLIISGYGAKFHLTTASAGWVFQQSTAKSFRHLRVEGLQCVIDSNACTDAFLFTDGGHSGSFWNWVARDLSVETGTASAPINNGIHVSNTSGTNVLFQFLIESCNLLQTANVTGAGILMVGGSNISSVEIRNPNVNGYLNGVQVGDSGQAITGATIIGGTIVSAQQEGVKLYCHGGGLIHTHVENSWLQTPTGILGGEIYIEGHGSIIEADVHRQTAGGHALWCIAVFASAGPVTIIGKGSDMPFTWVRIINTTGNTSGIVNIIGIDNSQVDFSQVLLDATPTLNLWQPNTRTDPTFPGAGGAVAIDASKGQQQFITVTDGTAFTISNPTNFGPGTVVNLIISNSSGGAMGAVTLGSAYKPAGSITVPANGKMRVYSFVGYVIHGTLQLIEVSRSPADI